MVTIAIELGTAYISILPSTSKLTAGINSSLKGAERQSAASGKKIGGNLFKGIALAGGGLAAAVGFGSLVKEAATASDAIKKFKQSMQFAGFNQKDIDKANKQTQDYANKTVYELGTVQNITAQLASNGIKNYVGLTEAAGNLNAVAGGNADTFKSVGMVLTQTAGQGKLTTENFNQLADAIPGASGIIQKALLKNGAYTGNFRDAMAKGQITAAEFNKAITEVGSNPAAKKAATSTSTFEGAIGALKASVVTALIPAMNALQPLVSSFADFLGSKAIPALSTFGGIVSKRVGPALDSIKGLFKGAGDSSSQLGKTFGALVTFGKALLPVFTQFGNQLMKTLGPALHQISDAFTNQLLPVFRAVLPVITPVVAFILKSFGSSIIGVIQGAVKVIVGLINVISGVFKVIKGVLTGNWKMAWDGVKQILSGALKAILGAIQIWFNWGILGIFKKGLKSLLKLWHEPWGALKGIAGRGLNAVKAVVGTIMGAVRRVASKALGLLKTAFFGALRSIRSNVSNYFSGYRAIISRAFSIIRSLAGKFFSGFKALFTSSFSFLRGRFSAAFNGYKAIAIGALNALKSGALRVLNLLKSGISSIWTKGIKPIFSALKGYLGSTVLPAMRTAVSKIAGVLNGLRSAARKPVEFLVNTVYMKGIYPMVGALPGGNPLHPMHFAKGGPVTGGKAGKDSVQALMMPGEHVLTAKEVKAAGGQKNIFALRKALLRGELGKSFDPDPPAFAKGGMLDPNRVAQAKSFARAQVGKPYVWGGVGPGGYDCSGFMSAITNVLRGNSPYSRVGATASFPWSGFKPGPGEFTIGSTPNYGGSGVGHMAGTLAGMPVESYGGHGPSVSHRGYNDPGFSTHAHLGAGGAGAAKSGGFFSVISDVKKLVGHLKGFMSGFSKFGEWGGIIKHVATSAAGSIRGFINDKIPGPGPIPGIFDNGGILKPGQLAFNASGRPEAVFNQKQFKSYAEGAARNNTATGPQRMELVLENGERFTGYVRSIAAAEVDGNNKHQKTLTGMRR